MLSLMIMIYAQLLLLHLIYMHGLYWRMLISMMHFYSVIENLMGPQQQTPSLDGSKNVLKLSGVTVDTFTAHSCRSASTSKARDAGVPLDSILKAGQWSTESNFYQFYSKEIVITPNLVSRSFSHGLLHPPPTQ